MEKFSDLFKGLKDRLSSPLISSFIIAWLVANWRIIIGLIFYKISDLERDCYKSYIDLIEKNTNLKTNLILPLAIALLYTFAFPFIKNVIIAFGAWIKRWGSKWRFEISKTEPISLSYYLELTEKNTELQNRLIKAIQAATKDELEISRLNLELINTAHESRLLKEQLDRYTQYNQPSTFHGKWRYKIYNKTNDSEDTKYQFGDIIQINQKLTVFQNGEAIESFGILYSVCNLSMWVLVMSDSLSNKIAWTFRIAGNNINLLEGHDHLNNKIEMEKIG